MLQERKITGERDNGCMRRSILNVYGAPTIILHALIGTDYTILSKTTKTGEKSVLPKRLCSTWRRQKIGR